MLDTKAKPTPRDIAAEHARSKPPPRKRAWILSLVVVAGLVGAVGLGVMGIWSRQQNEAKLVQWTKAQAIPTVAVVSLKSDAKNQELILPGDIEAYYEASIYARVPGYLKMWYKDIGARVKAGDQLAVIDTPDLDQQLEQSKSDLASVQASANLAELTAKR